MAAGLYYNSNYNSAPILAWYLAAETSSVLDTAKSVIQFVGLEAV